jgi:hypothetical protein
MLVEDFISDPTFIREYIAVKYICGMTVVGGVDNTGTKSRRVIGWP